MIVICEECGKRYQIDAGKIRGKQARFTCKSCGNPVTVKKPEEMPGTAEPAASPPGAADTGFQEPAPPRAAAPEPEPAEERKKGKKGKGVAAPKSLGLRTKMMILFFLVPILCVAAAGWLYVQQLQNLSTLITAQSSETVNGMAEELIEMKAKTVANQARIYLNAHPLELEEFNTNPEFRDIAVQKVGKTGYTAIYTIPDENGVSSLWAHPNEKLIGADLKKVMKKALGQGFDRFWKVYAGAFEGKVSKGYYPWQDEDGKIREKFMVCVPIENTPYVAPATTYLDEFTSPVQRLHEETEARTHATRNTIFVIVLATIVLIGVIVSLYGHKLTGRIQALTDIADRISVGELDAEIETQSNDEIGDLGEAVSRMQDSIRLSIERLRRRR